MDVIRKLNYIFEKKHKMYMVLLLLVILTGSALELIGVAAIMPLVEIVTNPKIIHQNGAYNFIYNATGMNDEKQFVLFVIAGLIIIYIFKNVYLLFMHNCQYRFTYGTQKNIAMRMMKCYMRQTYLFHVSKNVAELQRNMMEDVTMLTNAIAAAISLIAELITCASIAAYLLIVDKSITIALFLFLVMFILIFFRSSKNKSTKYGEIRRSIVFDMNRWIRQSFEGIKEIKIANKEEEYIKRVARTYEINANTCRKQDLINVCPRPVFEAVCISSLLGVVGLKIWRGIDLQYFIPVLSAFAIAAVRLLPSFGRLAGYMNCIVYNKPAIDNVFNDLKEIDELQLNYRDRFLDKTQLGFKRGIDVENVTFGYPNSEGLILDDVSLHIGKNESVAFIGSSGSGKTTLADIILGLLEPQSGHVLVDGKDISDKQYGWHMLLGYIPQSIYLIDDTIRRNVAFGLEDAEIDDEKVKNALRNAQLLEYVEGLDKGLDTIVGERGVRLSGGQRQRIGIARALYSNPSVLVLDEATSALDNETEKAVMDAVDDLKGSRTMIVVAHRLSTIKNCDRIFEVKDHNIEEVNKNQLF